MHKEIRYIDYAGRFSSKFFPKILFSYLFLIKCLFLLFITILAINNFFFIESRDLLSKLSAAEENEQKSVVEFVVKSGDNLAKLLKDNDVTKEDVQKIIEATKKLDLHKNMKVGCKIKLDYDTIIVEEKDLASEIDVLKKFTYEFNSIKHIEAVKNQEGNFEAVLVEVPLKKVLTKHKAIINSSFLDAAKSMQISTKSMITLINAFGHKIDFQRDLHYGDEIELIAEKYYTEEGKFSSYGDIVFASLTLSGKKHNIYLYPQKNEKPEYYSEDARSVKQSFLKTPLKYTRISGRFGMRKHPVLGYTKAHKGVDFAAPIGTPIFAAGDGVITSLAYKTGYGRYIKIKHKNGFATAYAHMSKYNKNLKCGTKVKQGQVIGFVGASGRATGPHLHYEILIDNKHVNPLSVKSIASSQLSGNSLKKFKLFQQEVKNLKNTLDEKKEIPEDQLTFLQ